ncbi:MAG: methylmalonyl Co-A mutase-associated GTPase MeaB [Rhodocyclales bacterium]|nr:methylmalonyl Co-A mutase-associated GTPase MeaB [Rhodocyclales bacterium]
MNSEAKFEDRLAGILAGRRRDLARAISEVENATATGQALLRAIRPHVGGAHVVGITGPGGAGKSTLIHALLRELDARGQSVGVVAVDPSSPKSGGALLGDRIRMVDHDVADKVFIRSLAARGHAGGLSRTAGGVVDLIDAAGSDVVIVETVGAGQAEVAICDLADTKVAVCPPGLGDDVQAMKAGMLEMADVLIVSKSDLPGAKGTARVLTTMLALRAESAWTVPVIGTVADNAEGVAALADALSAHARYAGRGTRYRNTTVQARRHLADVVAAELRLRLLSADSAELDRLGEELRAGRINAAAAADDALRTLSVAAVAKS